MRVMGMVRTQIWRSPDFSQLSRDAKLVWFYCLTSQNSNVLGIFPMPRGHVKADCSLDDGELESVMMELQLRNMAVYCPRSQWIVLTNYLAHNPLSSSKTGQAAVKILNALPPDPDLYDATIRAVSGRPHISSEQVRRLHKIRMSWQGQEPAEDPANLWKNRVCIPYQYPPKGHRPFIGSATRLAPDSADIANPIEPLHGDDLGHEGPSIAGVDLFQAAAVHAGRSGQEHREHAGMSAPHQGAMGHRGIAPSYKDTSYKEDTTGSDTGISTRQTQRADARDSETLSGSSRTNKPAQKKKRTYPEDLFAEKLCALWNIQLREKGASLAGSLSGPLRDKIRKRYEESKEPRPGVERTLESLEDWARFFHWIGQSDFLMGQTESRDRKPFRITMGWAFGPENFWKIRSGNYHENAADFSRFAMPELTPTDYNPFRN